MIIVRDPLRLLCVCLVVGLILTGLPLPAVAVPLATGGASPPPPSQEAGDFITPPAPAEVTVQAGLQAELAGFEAAREAGPAALVALGERLSPAALDLVIVDIAEARELLPAAAPPPPERPALDPTAERAAQEGLAAEEAAHRALALTDFSDPAEGRANGTAADVPAGVAAPAAPAADRTVGSGCTYATIAAAIAASGPGDRLLIEGGRTFVENVTVPLTLTLQGGFAGCASGSAARTTIDGNALGSVIIVNRAISVTLRNLNVTNGATGYEGGGVRFALGDGTGRLALYGVSIYGNTSQWGGGLWVGPDAEVTGQSVQIYDNTAASYGGGVRLWGGRIRLANSSIYNNAAPLGGGIYAAREGSSVPVITLDPYTDVSDNQALTGEGLGGGVYLRQGTLAMAGDSDLISNDAIHGGGAYVVTSTVTLDGGSSWIYNNTATGNGGGVYAQDSTVNLDNDAQLYSNGAQTGGGAYLNGSTVNADKAHIRYNTASAYGGGVYATAGSVLDMDLGAYDCFRARCSRLANNTATSYYGGGVYASASTADLRNTFIENNAAYYGGGAYVYNGSALYIYNSLFARNDAVGGVGDAIRLNASATLWGAGNTLAYNDAGGAATGNAVALATSSLAFHCGIIWGHTTSIDPTGETVTYSDVQGGYAGTGNLDTDPLFVAPGSSDYHLQDTSSLIDRCPTFSGLDTDFDNEARPVVRLSLTTPYDMGADETTPARVGINGGACTYGSIRDAVAAAVSGDTLYLVGGTYYENVDIYNKSLTLAGGYVADCVTPGGGTTTVNGLANGGSVFDIGHATVVLHDLRITGGNATGGGLDVGSDAHVTLDNADIYGNTAPYGGGVWVGLGAVVTATNGSAIYNNTATTDGGGVRVNGGKFVGGDTTSDIHDNTAVNGGGISVTTGGVALLIGSDLLRNQATGATGQGGGIHVTAGSVVTLTGVVWIYDGHTAYDGAGIYADASRVDLLGGTSIQGGTASHYGGGLYLTNGSTLAADIVTVGYPSATGRNRAVLGAGIYADSSAIHFTGDIVNNEASNSGAGLYALGGTVRLTSTSVGGTGANEPNVIGAGGLNGAGLYLTGGTHATLQNTDVTSNTLTNLATGYGGGLYVSAGSVVTLTNSRVERHVLPSGFDGRGAGIYVNASTVTLDNTDLLSNTAGTAAGAVRVFDGGTLNIVNGSELNNNRALSGEGGAIAVTSGTPDINLADVVLRDNTAATAGGAIYQDTGTLDFTGGWTLRSNTAGGNGGAVAVAATADAHFTAGVYSLVYDNRANGGDGGAFYLGNDRTMALYATSGRQLYIYANIAQTNGGALYADSGGLFDIHGQVNFDHNWALGGHGGAIYLGNGSRVWLDDDATLRPALWDNRAANGHGGAIYAVDSPRVELDSAIVGRPGEGNLAMAGSGGGIYLSGSTFDAENCTFEENRAAQHGGAIAAHTSSVTLHANMVPVLAAQEAHGPAAVSATECDPATRQCSAVVGNMADSDANSTGDGGGIYASDSTLTVDHTYLHRNQAYTGGAIYQSGAGAVSQINNSLIYRNIVSLAFGAGIRATGGALTVHHSTFANNLGGAAVSQSGTSTSVLNSIAWANASGFWGTFADSGCNIDQSGNVGLALDPRFVDPGAGDNYHLRIGSPAIDACATGLPLDLDGVTRPAGEGYDMGAFEFMVRRVCLPLVLRAQ